MRFFVRDKADAFERSEQNTDNGLRQTMHLQDVEYLICTSREEGRARSWTSASIRPYR